MREGQVWTPPDAAYNGWFSRVVPRTENKAVRGREQQTVFWLYGVWQILRSNKERESRMVCCKVQATRRA